MVNKCVYQLWKQRLHEWFAHLIIIDHWFGNRRTSSCTARKCRDVQSNKHFAYKKSKKSVKENDDRHDQAAGGHPGALPLADASTLPEGAQKAGLPSVENRRHRANVGAGADQQQDDHQQALEVEDCRHCCCCAEEREGAQRCSG